MQFLKTIFWVLVAVVLALFFRANWHPVTLNLWGEIRADIKVPALLLIVFLLGFIPTWLVMRARLWSMKRRLEVLDRQPAVPVAASAASPDADPVL
jgi:putative membrane protein